MLSIEESVVVAGLTDLLPLAGLHVRNMIYVLMSMFVVKVFNGLDLRESSWHLVPPVNISDRRCRLMRQPWDPKPRGTSSQGCPFVVADSREGIVEMKIVINDGDIRPLKAASRAARESSENLLDTLVRSPQECTSPHLNARPSSANSSFS